jgi:hypothetical protein
MAAVVAACAGIDDRDLPMSLKINPVGSVFADAFPVGDKRIPLPPGVWTVIGSEIKKDGDPAFHLAYMLVNIEDNVVRAATEVYASLAIKKAGSGGLLSGGARNGGWVTHRSCSRDDMHFVKVFSNVRLGDQDCWWINHWRMHRVGSGDSEHWIESRKYLEQNRIRAPMDMIGVSFRFANEVDYLTVNYFFDPATEGFAPIGDAYWSIGTWESSEWHPDRVKKEEKKLAYIKRLISWGEAWHRKVKASFEKG